MLRTLHPDYNYAGIPFRVNHLAPKPKHLEVFKRLVPLLHYDKRGEGVFQFWHGFARDVPDSGVWVYLFYEAACFIVYHGHRFRQRELS